LAEKNTSTENENEIIDNTAISSEAKDEQSEISFKVKLTQAESENELGDNVAALFGAEENQLVELKLLNGITKYFNSTAEWTGTPTGTYMVPVQTNWNSIDSLIYPNTAFQMTISIKHPYTESNVTDQFGKDTAMAFIYVVPMAIFNEFTFQKPKKIDAFSQNIRQYVIGIPDGTL
jgi:hypothetical protein